MKITYLKKLAIIFFSILMTLCTHNLNLKKNQEVISTMAMPVTDKVIVVDAGHRWRRWRSS